MIDENDSADTLAQKIKSLIEQLNEALEVGYRRKLRIEIEIDRYEDNEDAPRFRLEKFYRDYL